MPDIIRPTTGSSTVVVTISSVADQSTLNAVSPTVSATVDGSAATITAWAWKVNGATTGITGPTTATPSYTPTTAGAKVITCDVTILGVVYSSLPEIFTVGPTALSVSIAAVSDQLDLSAATLDSTVTGGVTPYTYAWTADGATTGLSSSTTADPTYTPTAVGKRTAVVTVTDATGQTAKASVTWRVGTENGWLRFWKAIPSGISDGDWQSAPNTVTMNGVVASQYLSGTADARNITSGVWTINTASGVDCGVVWEALDSLPGLDGKRAGLTIAIVVGVDASIGTNEDAFGIDYYNDSQARNIRLRAKKNVVQQIGIGDGGGITYRSVAGGVQARQMCLIIGPQRLSAKGLHATAAWSGDGLSPDDASWLISGGTPSGWWQPNDTVNESAATDYFLPDNTSTPDYTAIFCSGFNGTSYGVAGVTFWCHFGSV